MNIDPEIIGSVAGVLTAICHVPQVWKSFRSRSVGDISVGMYSVLTTGVALWFIYGLMIGDRPLIFSNAFALLTTCSMLLMKWKWRTKHTGNQG